MTEHDGLLDEIDKLKKEVAALRMMFFVSGKSTNQRFDVVESLVMTTSMLAQSTVRMLEGHLDALRNVPTPAPPESAPAKEQKKDGPHPEFG